MGAFPATHHPVGSDAEEKKSFPVESIDENREEMKEWDVKKGPSREGLNRLKMVLPAITRVATNVVGGTLVAGGYAWGKAGEEVGVGKAVDSAAFHAGLKAWLWSNGIFPKLQFEPLGNAAAKVSLHYGVEPCHASFLALKFPCRLTCEKEKSLTPVVISNHISYLDGPILACLLGGPRIVAKAGARNAPVVGKVMEEMDTIFVDRSHEDSRQATLEAISEHCTHWTPGDRPLLLFPEGTTTNGESLIDFKRGAFVAGVPVRPVLLVYTGQWDPASTSYKTTHTGDVVKESDAEWGAQFLGHLVHSIHARVLPPYFPDAAEKACPELYARNVQDLMAENLKRVRAELQQASWKEAAGRSDGGLDYKFGDFTRSAARSVKQRIAALGARVYYE